MLVKNPTNPIVHQPALKSPLMYSKASKKGDSGQESNERIHVHYGAIDPSSEGTCTSTSAPTTKKQGTVEEGSGRERLKRHRLEVAGRVWVPESWGPEDFLKDWIDCSAFDAALISSSVLSARASLVEQGRNANPARLGIKNI